MTRRRVKSEIKRGRLSEDEKKIIRKYCKSKSDAEIGLMIKRPPEAVQKYRLEYQNENPVVAQQTDTHNRLREELHGHFQWESFKRQFTKDELIFFENSYVELVGQFNSDILPTERKQIFQAITLEIFMMRHNQERMQVQEEIDRCQRLLNSEFDAKSPEDMSPAEKERVVNLENHLNSLRQSTQSKTKEYKDLSDKYSALLKESKATREQRISRATDSKQKFTDILLMLEEEELRSKTGIDMVLMNEAVRKEKERLSQLHTYADGGVEQPLLTPETYAELQHG
jgi:uncharacterized protein YeaO (DUF488 family)